MACHQASYSCRQQGLSPAGEILAVSTELKPWLFHLRAEGVVLLVWLRTALGVGWWWPSIPWHTPPADRWQSRRAPEAGTVPQAETCRCWSSKSPVCSEVAKAVGMVRAPAASATHGYCSLEFSKDSDSFCHLNLPITL